MLSLAWSLCAAAHPCPFQAKLLLLGFFSATEALKATFSLSPCWNPGVCEQMGSKAVQGGPWGKHHPQGISES